MDWLDNIKDKTSIGIRYELVNSVKGGTLPAELNEEVIKVISAKESQIQTLSVMEKGDVKPHTLKSRFATFEVDEELGQKVMYNDMIEGADLCIKAHKMVFKKLTDE